MRQHMLVVLALLATVGNAEATSAIAVREPAFLMLGADSKQVRTVGGPEVESSTIVCKIHSARSIYWAMAGISNKETTDGKRKLFTVNAVVAKSMTVRGNIAVKVSNFVTKMKAILLAYAGDISATAPRPIEVQPTILTVAIATFERRIPTLHIVHFFLRHDADGGFTIDTNDTGNVGNEGLG